MAQILMVLGFWLLFAPSALAQSRDGIVTPYDARFGGATTFVSEPVAWRREVRRPGSDFIRVHFDEIRGGNAAYTICIRDYRYDVVVEYSKEEFERHVSFWSAVIPGDVAVVEVVGAPGPPADLSFRISKRAFSVATAVFESITPPRNLPDIREVADAHVEALGRSVAKISYVKDDETFNCTGFMISDDLMLTNEHCINSDELCTTASVVFGFERDQNGEEVIGEQLRCAAHVRSDRDLDYALLRLPEQPGRVDRWGQLPLCGRVPAPDEAMLLIQHPAGEVKKISKDGCTVQDSTTAGRENTPGEPDFSHLCDTKDGSSGSPVLDVDGRVIGLHHLGFTLGDFASVNRAVRIGEVLSKLADVKEHCAGAPFPGPHH